MGLGNSAPPGPEATRKAEALYADTLMKSTVQQSATQTQLEILQLVQRF